MNQEPERPEEVFRGHFDECWRDFSNKLKACIPKKWSKGSPPDAIVSIADFCGADVSSVKRWMNGHSPVGEKYTRLVCFLRTIGYAVIEFERLPKARQNYSDLIGFGMISYAEASSLIGYSSTSHISNLLQGKEGDRKKDQRMWDLWKERKDVLEQKRNGVLEKLRADPALSFVFQDRKPSDVPEELSSVQPRQFLAVVNIVKGLSGLMTDEFAAELLKQGPEQIRTAASAMSRLSTRLSVVSSSLTASTGKDVADGK